MSSHLTIRLQQEQQQQNTNTNTHTHKHLCKAGTFKMTDNWPTLMYLDEIALPCDIHKGNVGYRDGSEISF